MLMVSSVPCACIWCVLLLCIMVWFARLAHFVHLVYVDGFFFSGWVRLVWCVVCVSCYMLPVLLLWFVLYMLMVSSVRFVCIWRVWFIVDLCCFARLVDLVSFVYVDGFLC